MSQEKPYWLNAPMVRLVAWDHTDRSRQPEQFAVLGWLIETTPDYYVVAQWVGEAPGDPIEECATILRAVVIELVYL